MSSGETIPMEPTVCAVIDDGLVRFCGRTLVSGTEAVDLPLDLRHAVDVETRLGARLLPVPG
jgi:hypothetical protein